MALSIQNLKGDKVFYATLIVLILMLVFSLNIYFTKPQYMILSGYNNKSVNSSIGVFYRGMDIIYNTNAFDLKCNMVIQNFNNYVYYFNTTPNKTIQTLINATLPAQFKFCITKNFMINT